MPTKHDYNLHTNRTSEITRVSCKQARLAPERPKEDEKFRVSSRRGLGDGIKLTQ